MSADIIIPESFDGIGYARPRAGLPLEVITVPVPRPGPDQILIRTLYSSLNPLDYKLAELNFLGRTPPVILGFDLAGHVAAVGDRVTGFAVGDAVVAMADGNGDGGWAAGGRGGYALARDYLTVKKPETLLFEQAAALPLAFIAAYLGLHDQVRPGDFVYIPGGGGAVGHLAIQIASRILNAGTVISSAGTQASKTLARASGADYVFDYRTDNICAEIGRLTGRRGVDVVYDITYNEESYVNTARLVRERGRWVVLGVGPGKTSRTRETESPVAEILAARGAQLINVNMLRYFQEPALLDETARTKLRTALGHAMSWAAEWRVVPHIDRIIDGTPDAINDALGTMKAGRAPADKIVVRLDREI